MADLRTLTMSLHGRQIDVVVDFDEMRLHKPPDLIDNTPDFMLWVHDMVRASAMRTIPAPPSPQPAPMRPRPIDPQTATIRRLEQSGRLCQGRVAPSYWNDGGKCSAPGVERVHPETDEALGRYCPNHFRRRYPEIASTLATRRPPRPSPTIKAPVATPLTQRTYNCLVRGLRGLTNDHELGCQGGDISPADIAAVPDDDLLSLRNFGKAALREVRAAFGPYDPGAIAPPCNWVAEGVPA